MLKKLASGALAAALLDDLFEHPDRITGSEEKKEGGGFGPPPS